MRRDLFRRCYCGTPPSRTRRRSSADSRVRAPTPRDQIPNESRPRVRPYREPEHRSKGKDLQTSLSLQGQGSGRFAHKGSQDNARVQDEKLAIGTWAGQKAFSTESAHALLAFRPHPRQLHFAIEERQLRLQMRANAAEYQRLQPTWIVVIGQIEICPLADRHNQRWIAASDQRGAGGETSTGRAPRRKRPCFSEPIHEFGSHT